MLPAFLVGMIFRLVCARDGITTATMWRAGFLFYFNAVAAADAAGLDDPAQQAAPPANRFLKTLADFVHLVARLARLGDFEQDLAGTQPLPEWQRRERDPARRNIFPDAPWCNPEFLERLKIHQQNLASASAPPVNAILQTLILKGKHFIELA